MLRRGSPSPFFTSLKGTILLFVFLGAVVQSDQRSPSRLEKISREMRPPSEAELSKILAEINVPRLKENPIVNCPKLPPHTPTDVHDLHPNDIKVVMAIGDSITAGFGVLGREGFLYEYRGLSGPIGGDDGAITAANFVRYFNPKTVGLSVGYHWVEFPGDEHYPDIDVLNGAQSGADSDELISQIRYVAAQAVSNPDIDYLNDWKVLSMLVGANDVCSLCNSDPRPSIEEAADEYERNIMSVFDELYNSIPRLFVNVVPMFNISRVYYLAQNLTYCNGLHDLFSECTCLYGDDQDRKYADDVLTEYRARIFKLVPQWYKEKGNSTDFALVIQPFGVDMVIPDETYISDLDCFHPSLLAHQRVAISGWNNMLTPAAKKKHYFDPKEPVICPDEDTKLYTW